MRQTPPTVAETQNGIERKRKPSMCIADLSNQPCKPVQIQGELCLSEPMAEATQQPRQEA